MNPFEAAIEAYSEGAWNDARQLLGQVNLNQLDDSDRGRALGLQFLLREDDSDDPDDEAAGKAIQQIVNEHSDQPVLLTSLGTFLSDSEWYQAAVFAFRQVVNLDPSVAVAWFNLGLAQQRHEQFEDAIGSYRNALERDPSFTDAQLNIAESQRETSRFEDSRRSYLAYLAAVPDDAFNWVSLGIVESELEHYRAARDAYCRAISEDPTNISAMFNLAITAMRADDHEMLAEANELLGSLDESDWRIPVARAWQHEIAGEVWQGWEQLAEALELTEASSEDEHSYTDGAYVAAQSLKYARENGIDDLDLLHEVIKTRGLHSQDVLYELRMTDGRESDCACLFAVSIEGRITDAETIAEIGGPNDTRVGALAMFQVIMVYAESDSDAINEALEFASRLKIQAERWVDEVEMRQGPETENLGIAFRSGIMLAPD